MASGLPVNKMTKNVCTKAKELGQRKPPRELPKDGTDKEKEVEQQTHRDLGGKLNRQTPSRPQPVRHEEKREEWQDNTVKIGKKLKYPLTKQLLTDNISTTSQTGPERARASTCLPPSLNETLLPNGRNIVWLSSSRCDMQSQSLSKLSM